MMEYEKKIRANTKVRQLRKQLEKLAKLVSEGRVELSNRDCFKLHRAVVRLTSEQVNRNAAVDTV
jgi:hypothetical protein